MEALPRALPSRPRSRPLTWREFRERSKARFAAELRERFFLRFHVVVILAGAVLAGTLVSGLALDVGVRSMPWRYLLGLGVAYLTFLAFVRLWIAYVSGWRLDMDPADALDCYDLASSSVRSNAFDERHVSSASDGGSVGLDLDLDDGILILLFVALAFAAFGGLVYLLAVGPGILTEAAFEVVLAGSLARRTGWLAHCRWLNHVVKLTVIPFLVVGVLTGAFASFAQELCPAATRLRDVVECVGR